MKILTYIIRFSLWICPLLGCAQQTGIGKWREHYSYRNVSSILVINHEICGVTENGLFYYDKEDGSVRRKTAIQGLSGVGLSTSNYDPATQIQIVGYQNGNIDLIQNGRVYNIPDLQRKEISGSKKINKIVIENSQKVYLCCDFGIVVLNLSKQEISETYFIGQNNSNLQINDLAIDNDTIYAATNKGLLSAKASSNRLNDASEWREITVDSRNGLFIQNICFWNKNLIICKSDSDHHDTIWRRDIHYQWHVLDSAFIKQIKVSKNRLFQLQRIPGEQFLYQIIEYDTNFQVRYKYSGEQNARLWGLVDIEVDSEHNLWFSTGYDGLTRLSSNWAYQGNILPKGPASNSVYALSHSPSALYSAKGSVNASYWTSEMLDFEVDIFRNDYWNLFNFQVIQTSQWLTDAIAVAEDPKNPNVFVVASWYSGVIQANADGSTTVYIDDTNCTLQWRYVDAEKHSISCGDVHFDKKNQLWVTNVKVENQLHKRTPSGEWKAYKLNHLITTDPKEFIIDYYDQLWIRTQLGGLVFFRETATGFDALSANLNRGNEQQISSLNCLIEDKNGYIWLGTDRGILVNYTSKKLFENPNGLESTVEFNTIIYEYRPLLENENITAIAVDGADRKWIGTSSSGVFLMSADGKEKIHHFNTENSPLNSNAITALAINPKNGDVFIGTDKGLMSYGGDATLGNKAEQHIVVFPNPVHGDFTGGIGIRGLVENAKVRITDASGILVFETTAKGGMAVWNGKTRNGQRAKPGVYIVFSTSSDGSVKGVGKIFFNR